MGSVNERERERGMLPRCDAVYQILLFWLVEFLYFHKKGMGIDLGSLCDNVEREKSNSCFLT